MKPKHVALIFLFLALWLFAQLSQDVDFGSSFSYRPQGARALSLLLERQGLNVAAWRQPFSALDASQTGASMVIISPQQLDGASNLLSWVKRGNTAILAGFTSLANPLTAELFPERSAEESIEKQFKPDFTTLLNSLDQTLLKKEHSVNCQTAGICEGVKHLAGIAPVVKVPENSPFFSNLSVFLLGEEKFALAFSKSVEKGEIWFILSPEIFYNDYIDRADNLRFAYQLISRSRTIYFDEFHHGYFDPGSKIEQNRLRALYFLLGTITALLVLYVLTRSVRFGPAQPALLEDNAASVEFAAVLGLLYREHQATSALKHYVHAWRNRLTSRLRLRSQTSNANLLAQLAQLGLIEGDKLGAITRDLEQLESAQLSESKLKNLVQQLEAVYQKL